MVEIGFLNPFSPTLNFLTKFIKKENIKLIMSRDIFDWDDLFDFRKNHSLGTNTMAWICIIFTVLVWLTGTLAFFSLSASTLYGVFTYFFLHVDFWHLFFNMLFLVFFGVIVERKIGTQNFILVFIGFGILAGIISLLILQPLTVEQISIVGSSGSIFGILGLMLSLKPKMLFKIGSRKTYASYAIVGYLILGGLTNPNLFVFLAHGLGFFIGYLVGENISFKK